jgi:hypothetical protein
MVQRCSDDVRLKVFEVDGAAVDKVYIYLTRGPIGLGERGPISTT